MAKKNGKLNIKAIKDKFGIAFRRAKFSVSGFINDPKARENVKTGFIRFLKWFITNPEKYIFPLKILAFLAAAAIYLIVVINIGADFGGGYNEVKTEDNVTLIARGEGFAGTGRVTEIELNWSDGVVELEDGKAYAKISASVEPDYFKRLGFSYKTSDPEIAEVSRTGDITAKKAGEVTITVRVNRIDCEAKARLKVLQPVTGLFMTTSNVTLYNGGIGQYLKVNVYPEDASDTSLKWESKNKRVATVDSRGHVVPVGVGMTEVTATTPDGKYSCKSFITVVNNSVKVDTVNIENGDSELKVGEALSMVASVLPYNAKNKTLEWISSDPSVATVSQTGRVKAVGEGQTQITVKSVNGISDDVNITVVKNDEQSAFDLYDYSIGAVVAANGAVTYETYTQTLPMLVELQMGLSPPPKIWRNGGMTNATVLETAEYMNPANYCDDVYKYQFLDLAASNGVSVDTLNAYLADKGILSGTGEIFERAAKTYNVSEVYLVAHACLETGNGQSQLSRGVEVNGITVYNMFGIGAYDSGALYYGSQKAYNEGWTSVEKAILGGAQWISQYYINSRDGRQNTLYKMLWNPENPGEHQYSTDIGWAVKQAKSIAGIFDSFPGAVLSFNVPVYGGQTAPTLISE